MMGAIKIIWQLAVRYRLRLANFISQTSKTQIGIMSSNQISLIYHSRMILLAYGIFKWQPLIICRYFASLLIIYLRLAIFFCAPSCSERVDNAENKPTLSATG